MEWSAGKRHGFTRLQLVLVLVVTAVVAAVSLSAFLKYRRYAEATRQRVSCQYNFKHIALCLMMYQADHDERYPIATTGKDTHGRIYGWADIMQVYLKNPDALRCPGDKHPGGTDPKRPGYTDYWYNRSLSGMAKQQITYSSSILLMGDGDGGSPQSTARCALNALPRAW